MSSNNTHITSIDWSTATVRCQRAFTRQTTGGGGTGSVMPDNTEDFGECRTSAPKVTIKEEGAKCNLQDGNTLYHTEKGAGAHAKNGSFLNRNAS